ncbi:translocator protein [Fimicolochytrium jonesii]|uniref:translocator protein n=1 Tax=Fimicolochytrium jonesii TaxID=1396493 RepID=UPI0022FE1B80|nr:translocator protein [Fimicolochytrium jonesii]KAI8817282.1 translocator protein [Fimicolochytrium jonesii]
MPSTLDFINKPLVTAVGVPLVLGMAMGTISRRPVQTWYRTINKPSWTPPNWAFPVAWTSLYAAMGYSSYLIYRAGLARPFLDTTTPLRLYAAQLALNIAWTPIFFGTANFGLATADILALLGTLVATTVEFSKIDTFAAWLLVPYVAWVSYASAMTVWIWRNNPKKGRDVRRKGL